MRWQAGLAEVALDVVLGGVAEAAVGLHGAVGGEEPGLGGEVLGDVGLLAARLAGVDQVGGLADHQVGGAQLGVGLGEREGDALVLADRAAEHDALVGVRDGPPQRRRGRCRAASAAIRMRSALSPSSRYWKPRPSSPTRSASGTSTSSYVVSHEATALRPIFGIARASTPSAWRSTRNSVIPWVGLAHSSSGVVRVSSRMRSASSAFDVHTLRPLIDVVVAVAHGPRRDVGRVGAGVGLGHAERDVQRPGGDVGQVALLHLLGAVDHDRVHAEHRQVQRRRAVHARARRGDLLRARSPPRGCPGRRRRSARGWRCRSTRPPPSRRRTRCGKRCSWSHADQ